MPEQHELAILLDGWRGWMPPEQLTPLLAGGWEPAPCKSTSGADPGYAVIADFMELPDERAVAHHISGAYEATPCHWMAGRDHVLLQASPQPTHAEAVALASAAADALDGTAIRVEPDGMWCVDTGFDLHAPGPLGALGRNVGSMLPMSGTPVAAKQFFNLLQMVWHEHPVNEARAKAGIAPINALWLSGRPHAAILDPICTSTALMPSSGRRARRLAGAIQANSARATGRTVLWLESVRDALLNGETEMGSAVRQDLAALAQVLASPPRAAQISLIVTGPDGARRLRRLAEPSGLKRLAKLFGQRMDPDRLAAHLFE
ncbi:hypothetical protein IP84_07265 [beta proteobacterium AAP99]|nr:hypothetical protein IP84_07265 [beta proteobacterium AAP99]